MSGVSTKRMDDKAWAALQLRASLAPHRENWASESVHWQQLGRAVDECRALVAATYVLLDQIEHDPNLSATGKKSARAKIGLEGIDAIAASKSLDAARASVTTLVAKWQARIDSVLVKPKADDAATATLFWEIRDKFSSLKDAPARLAWIERFGKDPEVLSALLSGPAGLTSLSDPERALLRRKIEEHADPKVVAARDDATKAMAETEQACMRAPNLIGERAGLIRGSDGSWHEPSANADVAKTPPRLAKEATAA